MKTFFRAACPALICVFILVACESPEKIRIIDASNYGCRPNSGENSTGKINRLIDSINDEPAVITFQKGRYDFYPDSGYFRPYFESNTYEVNPKRLAILLERKKNITIDGLGSHFVYHGHIQPFTVDNSENITIRNVNIDWDKPLTAESEVLEADSTHILVRIDTTQFPYKVHEKGLTFATEGWQADWRLSSGSFLIEYNKQHIIPAFTGDHGCVNGDLKNVRYSDAGPGLVTMEGNFTKTPTVGNYLIMRHSIRDHAGVFLFHSKNLTLENLNVYHTSGLGILSQYCENITMKKVNMIPNPNKNRYLSGHDDGLHFMGCKGKISIDSCNAIGLMDDPINIHGTCVPIVERLNDSVLQCRFAHDMSLGLRWAVPGDTIAFIDRRSMNTLAAGVVSAFSLLDKYSFTIEFQQSIPREISSEYALENLTWTPDAVITNCFVGSNRARGYLISTPGKVLVENNIFETSGSAILIAGDANYWFESGAVRNITIRNNEFRYPCNSSSYQFCNAIISIYPEIPQADSMHPYHRNITIEGNRFNPADYPIVYAKSVEGLFFRNNTITRSYEYEPWHPSRYNFVFDACKNVEIEGNSFSDDVLGKNVLHLNMAASELKINNPELLVK